jgi:hypothetical protein
MNAAVRASAAAMWLLAAACAAVPAPRPVPPTEPDAVRASLLRDETVTDTVRGLARVTFEGAQGGGSASHVLVVALPDRARVEALTPLGTTAMVTTLRANELRVHSVLQREYAFGPATGDTLGRLLRVPVPPGPLLRLLAGLPPLPLRAQDPRLTAVSEGAGIRVESVDGEHWQRLWIAADGAGIARGEMGRASEVLLVFAFADRRPTDGRAFPFEVRVEDPAGHGRLRIRYERVHLNAPADPDLFELPWPVDAETRFLDLGGATGPLQSPSP